MSNTRIKSRNKYGLARYIGEAVRREVRRRCGFGCVICGDAIITYEHFDPPFKDAKHHDPKGITLLCGGHQLETTKGLLSKTTIAEHDKDPHSKQTGQARLLFDLGGRKPRLLFGGAHVTECGPKIEIDGRTMLKIDPPEQRSSRWRLSCDFTDQHNNIICKIIENELVLKSNNIDVKTNGSCLSIHSDKEVLLDIKLYPPDILEIRKYGVYTANGRITIRKEKVYADDYTKTATRTTLRLETGGTSVCFDTCEFVHPQGLIFEFKNGQIRF